MADTHKNMIFKDIFAMKETLHKHTRTVWFYLYEVLEQRPYSMKENQNSAYLWKVGRGRNCLARGH